MTKNNRIFAAISTNSDKGALIHHENVMLCVSTWERAGSGDPDLDRPQAALGRANADVCNSGGVATHRSELCLVAEFHFLDQNP